MSRQPTTERGKALESAVRAALDACANYESSGPDDTEAGELGELYALTQHAEAEVLRLIIAMESDLTRAEQQASDAAALLIAAERQLAEWRACAEHGARLVVDAADGNDFAGGRIKAEMAILWARDVAPARIDPAAGTGDHEAEPGRNDEPAPVRVGPWLPRALREAGLAPSCSAARRFVTTSQVSVDCVIVTDPKTNLEPGDHVLRCGDGDALVRVEG